MMSSFSVGVLAAGVVEVFVTPAQLKALPISFSAASSAELWPPNVFISSVPLDTLYL